MSLPQPQVTPIPYLADSSAYLNCLRYHPLPIWLDSCHPYTQQGRYDILAAAPSLELITRGNQTLVRQQLRDNHSEEYLSAADPFSLLDTHMPAPCEAAVYDGEVLPFCGGALGYLSYDLGRRLEAIPSIAEADSTLADMHMGIYQWALVIDHKRRTAALVAQPGVDTTSIMALISPLPDLKSILEKSGNSFKINNFENCINKEDYIEKFDIIQKHILEGDTYQINYAQRFCAPYGGDPYLGYLKLRQTSPAPFAGFMGLGDNAILSLSPERFIACRNRVATTSPIKGTAARHADPSQDAQSAATLSKSEKDQAENLMIVDLLRNDLSRCCRQVEVPKLFELQSFANVHHLVSTITGVLKPEKSAIDLLRAAFPGGSITGAPKVRAMEIIETLESHRRGPYCGSLSYISACGSMDSNIAIRTISCDQGRLLCWGGGGIVADSTCESEYQESITKVALLIRTLEENFLHQPATDQ
ncbi:aminodeoxychorismate synthase component I [Gilvimarinus sp. DA14]|uniref:aminodeoxychorismate synthase component I n=1 Tax=Gilvimarinus sp. DA14 TaxID=2956798 RepID=UPI0020B7D314|nr:aminodeoxychorismate synthase component I [Gilvimarinus sp. DA14]UTF60599.1 aminodeoxychorismate synthase component I [Gilvimarinus sp. DA14]